MRRSAPGPLILVVLLPLLALGCDKARPSASAGSAPIGTLTPSPNAPADGAEPGAHPQPTAAFDRNALAREVLSQSLNATAPITDALVAAPLYRLAIDIDYELFTYTGRSEVHLVNTEGVALAELVFFLYPNSPELAPAGARNLAVSDVQVDGRPIDHRLEGPTLRIPLAEPLSPGSRATVSMAFRGNLVRLAPGASDLKELAVQQLVQLFTGDTHQHGGYGIFSYADHITSLALWYPILAAHDEEGWDLEPGGQMGDVSYFDVANYELKVTAPEDVAVIASGVETGRREADGRLTTTFAGGAMREVTVQMSTRYRSASAFVNGVRIQSWFLESDRESGLAVLEHAKEAVRIFDRTFGPYPWTELDLVEAPLIGGAGGVEFPGLVTIAEMFYARRDAGAEPVDEWRRLLADNQYMQDTLEFVVAHEVAHQWWNAVVGSDSKTHPFVDEALANHSAIVYFEQRHGKDAAALQTEVQLRLPYRLARMAGSSDRPVDLPTAAYSDPMEYAAIVYGKGGLYFEEMRARFGDASHFGFLKEYTKKHRFQVATPDDLIGGLVRSSRDPGAARAISDRWLKESHGDEDVGDLQIAVLVRYLVGPEAMAGGVGRILEILDHRGAAEIARLVQRLLAEEDAGDVDVDWGEITKLVASMIGGEPADAELWAMLARLLSAQEDLLSPDADLQSLLKGLARGSLGGDPKTDAIIDIADGILELLSAE